MSSQANKWIIGFTVLLLAVLFGLRAWARNGHGRLAAARADA